MKDTVEEQLRRIDEMSTEEQVELASHEDALEFWDKIMRSVRQPMQRRMKAAELRAQYKYAKLGAIAVSRLDGRDFASLLEKAIQRSQRGAEVKQIEAHALDLTSEKSR
jgi:hypothetical protein